MGSVVTYWSGCSESASNQTELVAYIEELAVRNEARLRRGALRRPVILETSSAQCEPPVDTQRASIVRLDHECSGRILIGTSMLLLDQFSELMQQSARLIASPEAWQSESSFASLAVLSRADEQRYAIQTPAFRLRGIAFRLYDPRRLFPSEDTMSFAFVESPEFPVLDGQMVHAFSRHECATLDGEWFQKADWTLDTPSIHLRYYLEEWFDLLMVWIKIFFIPKLEYWRNNVLNRYAEIKESIDRLIASDGVDIAKQAIFEYLLEWFESEADQLENEIARIAEREV